MHFEMQFMNLLYCRIHGAENTLFERNIYFFTICMLSRDFFGRIEAINRCELNVSSTRGLQNISNENIGKIGAPITHMTSLRLSWSYRAQCISLFWIISCFSIAKVKSE